MGTPTLFGDSEEIAAPAPARNPPLEGVVEKLVALGVSERTARGYESRQAFRVLKNIEAVRRPDPPPPPPPEVSPARAELPPGRGAPIPLRLQVANELEYMLEHEMTTLPWEKINRTIGNGTLYLTRPECVRLVWCLIRELRSEG